MVRRSTVKTKEGEVKVNRHRQRRRVRRAKATLADLKPGSFVGVGAMPQPDGTQKAIQVISSPRRSAAPARAIGRGSARQHHDQRRRIDTTVTSVDGQTIMVKYKDGEKKIIVAADVLDRPAYEIGGLADLKAGAAFTDRGRDQEAGRHAGGGPRQRRPRRGGAAVAPQPQQLGYLRRRRGKRAVAFFFGSPMQVLASA